MPYDIFISYSRRDNQQARVTQLVDHIKADFAAFAGRPLVPFFDITEINGMEDWRHRILQGLRESRLLLACLSPGYIQSEYCGWEFNEYLKHEVARLCVGEGVAPIYFVEVPGWGDKDYDMRCAEWVAELRRRQNIDLRPWFNAGEEALREDVVRARMEKLNAQLADRIQRGERAEHGLGNVDAHNPHFIGRKTELRRMRETVALGRVGVLTVVHGLGGVGKTALAIECAHAFAHEYGGGRWQVRCEGKENLRAAVCELGTPLAIEFTDEEKRDLERQFQRVLRELRQLAESREPHRCLLILDNVDKPKLLEPAQTQCLPTADWFHVIATTRLGEVDLFGAQRDRAFLPVDELPEDDALALIQSYQPDGKFRDESERTAALEIVRLLGRFTLAVEAAAVYLGQYVNDVTCTGFLARLKREGLEGLDAAVGQSAEGVRHGEMRLSATLGPTLERLNDAETLALQYAALLPADFVALPWLRALVAETHPEIAQDAEPGYPDPWRSLLRRLFSLRLLQPTGAPDADGQPRLARVHRLLQELVRSSVGSSAFRRSSSSSLSPVSESADESTAEPRPPKGGTPNEDAELAARQEAVDRLVRARAGALEKTMRWQEARWELEPLDATANLWADTGHKGAAWLLTHAGLRWHDLAAWSRAEPVIRRALATWESSYGSDHPNVAGSLIHLARLLRATNRLAEAEPLYRRALEIRERSYGPDHPNVAASLNNLAQLLQTTNRLAEAEPLMRRALEIDERSYGPDHPDLATALNNLAELLRTTNRLVEAEPLMRRALEIDERSYGPGHPKVAIGLNNLAQLLKATNRLVEAEPLMRRALEICERSYGPDHPHVAVRLNNLAQLLQATNRLAEAEPLMRRALEIDERSYGPDHPDLATALNNLAGLLQDTNRLVEAEPLTRRALEIDERSYRPDHPKVAIGLNNLAQLLKATNRPAEAEPLMRRALEICERSYGPDHPHVAVRLNNLAGLLQDTNRLGEAEPLMRRALESLLKFMRVTSHPHPHLDAVGNNYVALLRRMGRSEEQILATLRELAPELFR